MKLFDDTPASKKEYRKNVQEMNRAKKSSGDHRADHLAELNERARKLEHAKVVAMKSQPQKGLENYTSTHNTHHVQRSEKEIARYRCGHPDSVISEANVVASRFGYRMIDGEMYYIHSDGCPVATAHQERCRVCGMWHTT